MANTSTSPAPATEAAPANEPPVSSPYCGIVRGQLAQVLASHVWGDPTAVSETQAIIANASPVSAVKQVLEDPRAHIGLRKFALTWFGIAEQPGGNPGTVHGGLGDPSIDKETLDEEVRRYVGGCVGDGQCSLTKLLGGSVFSANDALANYYGLPIPQSPKDPGVWYALDGASQERFGIFARGAWLVRAASVEARGRAVMEDAFCMTTSAPTTGHDFASAGAEPDANLQINNRACAQCHLNIDPLGRAFEHFDGLARHLPTRDGIPVSTAASFTFDGRLGSEAFKYENLEAFALQLAESPNVQSCVLEKAARYLALPTYAGDFERSPFGCVVRSNPSLTANTLAGALREVLIRVTEYGGER
ncbi:MAG: DUF1588 domain-containing protein [Polyangiaceae bacterium]|nr:DUF1588 domain-containing protein [Polyangiaceae bacterium]